MATVVESFVFQAETKQLLQLMINSLYTKREIFLRELISNASDALDRLRFESLTNPEVVQDHVFEIRLKPDQGAGTLTICDSGIGMSRDELIANIGTIARSGTQEFRRRIEETASLEACAELIGQFGVGFYSAFMVADEVTVVTRRAGEQLATRWNSSGDGTYTVTPAERSSCGTDVILRLKRPDPENGIEDYAERWKLATIVRKYSDFIAYPIVYEETKKSEEYKDTDSWASPNADTGRESQVLNSMKPIWTRQQAEVPAKDYHEFYNHLTNDWNEPLRVLSLKAEGIYEHEALLFIPAVAPQDLFYHAPDTGLRLYSKRVVVMDKCEDLLPRYLRFVRGVVDSNNLPLNISRQRLQQDRHVSHIKKWLTRKILETLAQMQENEPDTYRRFWQQFGRAVKEGISFDRDDKDKLIPLLLFESSHDPENWTSLQGYVERMKPQQTEIFYLTGDSRKVIENSPHLESVRERGYEVLYLSDAVDELLVQSLHEFDNKRLKSVGKGILNPGTEEERTQKEEQLKRKQEHIQSCLRRYRNN
jgi:molecular chaperone HtpG